MNTAYREVQLKQASFHVPKLCRNKFYGGTVAMGATSSSFTGRLQNASLIKYLHLQCCLYLNKLEVTFINYKASF